MAFFFWPRPSDDPTRQAAAEIAKNCAGGRQIDNSAKIEAGLSRYLTQASGDTKVSASDVGTVMSKLTPDGVGLEFYKVYTQCLTDGSENYLKLKGIAVVPDPSAGQKPAATPGSDETPRPDGVAGTLQGYIYYEENSGRVTSDGVFEPYPKASLPQYNQLKPGMVLRTVRSAEVRDGPTGDDTPAEKPLPARQCVKVIGEPKHPPSERLMKATSGGRILVEAIVCPHQSVAGLSRRPRPASTARGTPMKPGAGVTVTSINQSGGVTAAQVGNVAIGDRR
ncbi:MAG: hypothetical protein EOP62_11745 [Sphingomonadales bacterium]|nr:MAG: hypothetical protein EOP62_11745 [Sphingomonadales bacterium]